MTFDPTISLGAILQLAALLVSAAGFYFGLKGRADILETRFDFLHESQKSMQIEVEKIATVMTVLAVSDQRLKTIERRIDGLKCSECGREGP